MSTEAFKEDTVEYKGYSIIIRWHYDSGMGEPWKEHDGHGIVSDWTSRDKAPGELVLCEDRRSKRYYDFRETLKIAKKDGWGVSEEDIAKHNLRTAKRKLTFSVMSDYKHLKGWCNDEWHWCGYTVEIQTPEEEELKGVLELDSLWGIESTDAEMEYHGKEALESAKAAIDKIISERESVSQFAAELA